MEMPSIMLLKSSSEGATRMRKSARKGNVNFVQRLMTYGHCFLLYLGMEIFSRSGDVSGERGAYGSRVHWRGVSSLYIEMCRREIMSKIGLYGFDKDKIPCQSPIHNVNISIRETRKS